MKKKISIFTELEKKKSEKGINLEIVVMLDVGKHFFFQFCTNLNYIYLCIQYIIYVPYFCVLKNIGQWFFSDPTPLKNCGREKQNLCTLWGFTEER